ncbi:MAG: ferritin-like domain-containing protein, partial [Polyangiaceae bacterium]
FDDTNLTAIAKLVLREGCLGETVASLEALAVAEVTTEPSVRRALTRIARDELRHAELAFQFLRWVVTGGPAEVHEELSREAEQRLREFESAAELGAPEHERCDDRLAAHGLIAEGARRAIHLAAARDVVRPLLTALFEVEAASVA